MEARELSMCMNLRKISEYWREYTRVKLR